MKSLHSIAIHLLLSGAALALALFVSGCIIIPTPEFDSGSARSNFNKDSTAQIQPGVTAMEDVLLTFGEPDAISPDERKLAYRSQKIVAIWFAGGGYSATGGTIARDRYLLVEFDEHGVVRNREPSAQRFFPLTPDKLLETKGWLDASAASPDEAAVISGEVFWFPNTEGFKKLSLGPGEHARGYLVLTKSGLQFRDRTQLGDTPPRWSLSYDVLAECRIAKFGRDRRVVIRTQDDQVHSFNFVSGALHDKKKTEAACQFIRSRISNNQATPLLEAKP